MHHSGYSLSCCGPVQPCWCNIRKPTGSAKAELPCDWPCSFTGGLLKLDSDEGACTTSFQNSPWSPAMLFKKNWEAQRGRAEHCAKSDSADFFEPLEWSSLHTLASANGLHLSLHLCSFVTFSMLLPTERFQWEAWGPPVPVHGLAWSRCPRVSNPLPGLPQKSENLQPSWCWPHCGALQVPFRTLFLQNRPPRASVALVCGAADQWDWGGFLSILEAG